jgi:hypothetical protein
MRIAEIASVPAAGAAAGDACASGRTVATFSFEIV